MRKVVLYIACSLDGFIAKQSKIVGIPTLIKAEENEDWINIEIELLILN